MLSNQARKLVGEIVSMAYKAVGAAVITEVTSVLDHWLHIIGVWR